MAKPSLHQFYLDLMPNLLRELYFYIPETQIPKDIVEKLDVFQKHIHLNTVYVIDYHKGPMLYTTDRDAIEATIKTSKLEKNLFSLVEKRSEISPLEFDYLLNKYFEFVELLLYISEWMHSNLKAPIKNVAHVKGLFNLQSIYFKKHFEAVVKTFYPNRTSIPKGDFDAHYMMNTYFPDISKGFKIMTGVPAVNNIIEDKPLESTTKASKKAINKTKKPLVAEVEAETLLLKTFFNIV